MGSKCLGILVGYGQAVCSLDGADEQSQLDAWEQVLGVFVVAAE
jgi:hypothetical protein